MFNTEDTFLSPVCWISLIEYYSEFVSGKNGTIHFIKEKLVCLQALSYKLSSFA